MSARTGKEYAADWERFRKWCQRRRRRCLPATAKTVRAYLEDRLQAGHKLASLARYASGINAHHRERGRTPPADRDVRGWLAAEKRKLAEMPDQKAPLSVEQLRNICRRLGTSRQDIRDRALLTIGFASALRRSNLAALDIADARMVPQGVILTIRREKQDRRGDGRLVGVARGEHPETDPVAALEAWLRVRGEGPGSLFGVAACTIALILKRHVKTIGLDPSRYSGHSMRAGFVTTGIECGVNELLLAAQTGHRSLASLRRYYRNADPFRGANASALIGL